MSSVPVSPYRQTKTYTTNLRKEPYMLYTRRQWSGVALVHLEGSLFKIFKDFCRLLGSSPGPPLNTITLNPKP